MAHLLNDSGTLRFELSLADRESLPGLTAEAARLYGSASVEYLDQKDRQFWPFIRLAVVKLAGRDPKDLHAALKDLCAKVTPAVAFTTGEAQELALTISRQEGGGFVVEVGVDLQAFLRDVAGVQGDSGRELSLFRFTAGTSEVVRFADALLVEWEMLPPIRNSTAVATE